MVCHQVTVEDVPCGGYEATVVTDTAERVCVHLEMAFTVGLGGEGRQADEAHEGALSTVAAHVDLQRAGAGAALSALGEGADTLIGVGLFGFLFRRRDRRACTLAAGTVVEQVGLQVPLTTVPDPAVFAGEDVLVDDCGSKDGCHASLLGQQLDVGVHWGQASRFYWFLHRVSGSTMGLGDKAHI